MFTGIVEETGTLVQRTFDQGVETFEIEADKVMSDLAIGHSIAVNGVCLTVVKVAGNCFDVQVIPETLHRSNLGELASGRTVNLERAMAAKDRFHGHVVQGHVETVGYINGIVNGDGEVRMTITMDNYWERYCIPKGSIAINGVSLTIAEMSAEGITVALIPLTLAQTTLGGMSVGDAVNIETDMFARYLERFLEIEEADEPWGMDQERLRSWGFGES